MVVDSWEHDFKSSAVIQPCLVAQNAAMFVDNAGGNGQAQSGAALFGGEEGVEEALLDFGRDARAGISHGQNGHGTTVRQPEPRCRPGRGG